MIRLVEKRKWRACSEAYTSKLTGAFRWSKTSITASLTSGPIPSPGIMVTVWGLASPGEGTYVIFVLICTLPDRLSALECVVFLALLAHKRSASERFSCEMMSCIICAISGLWMSKICFSDDHLISLTCWACSNGLESPKSFFA